MTAPLALVLDHAGTSVADLDRSQTFYSEAFGFEVEEEFRIPVAPIRGLVLKHPGGARVELFCRDGSEPSPPGHPIDSTQRHGWFQLAFRVEQVDEAFDRVVACGARAVKPPFTAPDGVSRVAFVGDPDGNLIELIERGG